MSGTRLLERPSQGLHGPLADLARIGLELLRPTLLDPAAAATMRTVAFPGLPGVVPGVGNYEHCDWGLGVEIRGDKRPHWTSDANSPGTFGHIGGSGGFLWVDPAADLAVAALTDRDFGPWALEAWPPFSAAVLAAATVGGAPVNVIRSFLRTLATTPLVYPVLFLAAVVSAIAAPWAARRTGLGWLPAGLLLFSLGAVLAITLTPGIGGDPTAPITCQGLVPAPNLSELWSLTNENGQNVLLFVPLGLFIGLIPRRNVLVGAAVGAAALPFAIEGIQALLPGFARSCQAWDVVENVLGLAIGLVIGSLLAGLVRIADQPEAGTDRP